MVLSLMPTIALADDSAAETIEDAILYTINDGGELEYNVTHAAPVSDTVAVSGEGLDSLAELEAVMGEVDKPAVALGTDPGQRTIGKAVTADLGLDADGSVVSITVTDISERPIVGISWKKDTIGTDYQGFAEAYERNGAIAVYLPQVHNAEEAQEVLSQIDGIFFTGGEDWNPSLYDEVQSPHGSSGWNDARDTSDINLMQQAVEMDVPLFAVCRGEQGFNVAMGGGLIQDIPYYLGQKVISGEIDASRVTRVMSGAIPSTVEGYENLSDEIKQPVRDTGYTYYDEDYQKIGKTYLGYNEDTQSYEYADYDTGCEEGHLRVNIDGLIHSGAPSYHELEAKNDGIGVSEDSKWLYDIVGDTTIDLVATAHHQAVNPEKLGDGLTIVARSSDGIVEAIEHQDNLFALAIQWHPERDALGDSSTAVKNDRDPDNDLCNAFLRELVKYAGINRSRTVAEIVEDAILYTINDDGELEYNVTHSAPVADDVTVSGRSITSLAALVNTMGEIDKPEPVLSTDTSSRTIGKAVTADLGLNANGEIIEITVSSVDIRPVVGISWKKNTVGKDYQGFAEAFERNGAIAVFLPQITDAESAREVLSDVNGIFVTGGEDWNPSLYDEEAYIHGSSGWNDARDTSDINLMQQAIEMDVPMLAVCRGEQGFNVAMGGGLIQDIPTYLGQKVKAGEIDESRVTVLQDTVWVNEGGTWVQGACTAEGAPHYRVVVDGLVHSGGTGYHVLDAGTDGIGISEDSKWLYDIVGDTTIDVVATAHHQAVNPEKLGDGLTIVAKSSDGIVEAIEHQDSLFALALQWHPERDALGDSRGVDVDNDLCNALLGSLVEYASVHYERENPTGSYTGGGSSSGSSGGSSSSSVTYTVSVSDTENGTVTVSPKSAKAGATVTITVKPDAGFELASIEVTDQNGSGITVKGDDRTYTFAMPKSSATVTASFQAGAASAEGLPFTDVSDDFWAYDAIEWAYENGYMNGKTATTFQPDGSVTRQQLWMILARLSGANPADMAEARTWAMSTGVSDGSDPGTAVSRQQMVTMLYRYAGLMGYTVSGTADLASYPDSASVSGYAQDAMSWSVANGIVAGTASGTLDPAGTATRAQFSVILMRFCEKMA